MIDRILSDVRYLEKINRLNEIEKDRIYCRHDLEHFEEVSATQEFSSPNFLEKGAMSLYKDYESGSNDISAGVFTQSVMLDPKEANLLNRKQKCC